MLNNKIRKVQLFYFELNKKELEAMKSLEQKVIFRSVLALPYAAAEMTLHTGGCNIQV